MGGILGEPCQMMHVGKQAIIDRVARLYWFFEGGILRAWCLDTSNEKPADLQFDGQVAMLTWRWLVEHAEGMG